MSEDPESATGNKPNTVSFPGNDEEQSSTPVAGGKGKRTLSELLKLHAEKGTDVNFTAEEATRVAEVLGQWVGVPYAYFHSIARPELGNALLDILLGPVSPSTRLQHNTPVSCVYG